MCFLVVLVLEPVHIIYHQFHYLHSHYYPTQITPPPLGAVRVGLGLDAAELEVPVRVAAQQGVQVAHELVDVPLACKEGKSK